jgi:hypothetical protein
MLAVHQKVANNGKTVAGYASLQNHSIARRAKRTFSWLDQANSETYSGPVTPTVDQQASQRAARFNAARSREQLGVSLNEE